MGGATPGRDGMPLPMARPASSIPLADPDFMGVTGAMRNAGVPPARAFPGERKPLTLSPAGSAGVQMAQTSQAGTESAAIRQVPGDVRSG